MAITYIGGLNTNNFSPGFNRVNYYFDSTNKNKPGFRYVVDLYKSGTSTKVWEGRIAPRIGDGYGLVMLQKILQAFLSFDADLTAANNAPNSWYKFDLKIGEEFGVSYELDATAPANDAGYLQYTLAASNPFAVGDRVELTDNANGVTGLFTVIVSSGLLLTIDYPFSDAVSGFDADGSVLYADNRKTIKRDLSAQTATVFNGAVASGLFPSFQSSDYKVIATGSSSRFITSCPSAFEMALNADAWVNVGNFFTATPAYVYFANNNGDLFRKSLGASTASAIRQVSVGPNNVGSLSVVSGSLPLIKADTGYYQYWVANSSGVQMSEAKQVNLNRRCRIEDTMIVFVDRMGSVMPFSFPARMAIKGTVRRETYRKDLGDLIGGKYSYLNTDGGMVSTAIDMDKDYSLTTHWLSDDASLYFEELVTSPVTYVSLDGVYYRCEVTDTSFDVERTRDKKLIKKKVTVRMSNPDNINI